MSSKLLVYIIVSICRVKMLTQVKYCHYICNVTTFLFIYIIAVNMSYCDGFHEKHLIYFLQIQGKYYLKFDPQGEGAKWRRTFGQEIYSPLLLAFSEQVWSATYHYMITG